MFGQRECSVAELTDEEILVLLDHGDQSLVTAVERILAAREAAAERPRYMVVSGCIDTEDYARISNDAFDSALEQVIEELHDYCDPDDDADTATILRGFAAHLGEWRPEVRDPATVPDPAAERRGAVNALREAAATAERLRADNYLARVYRERADRIEAGDA
jgi:hypothetical protein